MNPARDRGLSTVPFDFGGLPCFRRDEVELWNWFHRIFPGEAEWQNWTSQAFSHLLMKPTREDVSLSVRNALEPEAEERIFKLDQNEISIGRAPENTVVLTAQAIGRRHARILRRDGKTLLEDLGSQFGTHIGSRKLEPNQPEELGHGGRFVIFPYEFRLGVRVEWGPEDSAQIFGSRAASISWESFASASRAGSMLFPVFVHPVEEPAYLEGASPFLSEIVGRLLQPLRLEQHEALPLNCDEGLLEFAMLSVLEAANRSARFPFRVEMGHRQQRARCKAGDRGIGASFSIRLSGLNGAFRLFVPYALLAGLNDATPPPVPPRARSISWMAPVSAGSVDLTPAELAGVERFDIVLYTPQPALFAPGSFEKGWNIVVQTDNPWRVRLDKCFDRSVRMQTTGPGSGPTTAPDLRTLPVRLHVVIGEKELTLAEMENLVPNTILELGTGKADPVRLVVNGKTMGEGELVEVEGKLGVRILSWS